MPGPKVGRMVRQVDVAAKKAMVAFGRIASGTHLKINIKNVADSEAREIRVITPYGVSSAPLPELFAQILFNDHINNTCPGIWNDKAPEAKPGEIILYNKDNVAQVKLLVDGTITMVNKNGSITLKPNGVIEIKNAAASAVFSAGGAVSITGGAITINGSTFTVNSSGAVHINGSSIDLN